MFGWLFRKKSEPDDLQDQILADAKARSDKALSVAREEFHSVLDEAIARAMNEPPVDRKASEPERQISA